MRAFEWETGLPPGQRQYKFDALITTYEMVLKDSELLRPIKWVQGLRPARWNAHGVCSLGAPMPPRRQPLP